MARPVLSKRVRQIYDFICSYSKDRGYPPSVREIGQAVGLRSPSTVHMHLCTLEEQGFIRKDPNKPRTIEIVNLEDIEAAPSPEPAKEAPVIPLSEVTSGSGTDMLPLVGRVAAGSPILAEQNIEDTIPVPTAITHGAGSFLLRVRGDSMINAGIFDGDYLVVREQKDAVNGEIVVALIDDGATVKTFYREETMIRLQPENDAMEPIYVRDPRILGRVVALLRSI